MASKLIELEARAAIRYLNMDMDEFERLRNKALELYYRELFRDVARVNGLNIDEFMKKRENWGVPVREILRCKRRVS